MIGSTIESTDGASPRQTDTVPDGANDCIDKVSILGAPLGFTNGIIFDFDKNSKLGFTDGEVLDSKV